MEIKSFFDLIDWTRKLHENLAECLVHCAPQYADQRTSLLLDYLVKHEKTVAQLIHQLEGTSSLKVLNAHCDEYLDQRPFLRHQHRGEDFVTLNPDEIMKMLVQEHEQIIELYRHLYWHAETISAQDILKQLLELEEHQAMKIAQVIE